MGQGYGDLKSIVVSFNHIIISYAQKCSMKTVLVAVRRMACGAEAGDERAGVLAWVREGSGSGRGWC